MSLVVLLETQLSERGIDKAIRKLSQNMNRFVIPAVGYSEGIVSCLKITEDKSSDADLIPMRSPRFN